MDEEPKKEPKQYYTNHESLGAGIGRAYKKVPDNANESSLLSQARSAALEGESAEYAAAKAARKDEFAEEAVRNQRADIAAEAEAAQRDEEARKEEVIRRTVDQETAPRGRAFPTKEALEAMTLKCVDPAEVQQGMNERSMRSRRGP